jgi:hypothetical protein
LLRPLCAGAPGLAVFETWGFSQTAKPSDDEKALLGINEAWAEAEQKHDAATLDRLLDDGFISVSSGGKIQNKADFLSDILQTKIISSQITDELGAPHNAVSVCARQFKVGA